jgi:hypothetical protein
VGGDALEIDGLLSVPVRELSHAHAHGLGDLLGWMADSTTPRAG